VGIEKTAVPLSATYPKRVGVVGYALGYPLRDLLWRGRKREVALIEIFYTTALGVHVGVIDAGRDHGALEVYHGRGRADKNVDSFAIANVHEPPIPDGDSVGPGQVRIYSIDTCV